MTMNVVSPPRASRQRSVPRSANLKYSANAPPPAARGAASVAAVTRTGPSFADRAVSEGARVARPSHGPTAVRARNGRDGTPARCPFGVRIVTFGPAIPVRLLLRRFESEELHLDESGGVERELPRFER